MEKINLVPIKNEALKEAGIPFTANTLYNWHSKAKFSDIFVKIGGKVFINANIFFEKVANQSFKKTKKQKNTKKNISIKNVS